MKNQILKTILYQFLNMNKSLKKKLLIGAGILGVFILLIVGFTAYLGFKATSYLVTQVSNQPQVTNMVGQVATQGQQALTSVTSQGCLQQLQAHLNVNVWIQNSMTENTNKILSACLGQAQPEKNQEWGG